MLTLRDLLETLDGAGIVITEDWDTIEASLPPDLTLDRVLRTPSDPVPPETILLAVEAYDLHFAEESTATKVSALRYAVRKAIEAERGETATPQEG